VSKDESFATRALRGLARRCARCGGPAFESWFRMAKTCPRCGVEFEREEGYWVGAMIMNTTVTFLLFGVAFIGLIVATWPDVQWGAVMATSIGICGLVPLLFYPISKSLWFGLETSWHPLEDDELEAARARVG
jgi:uncharacterized protein (DUF983 family)